MTLHAELADNGRSNPWTRRWAVCAVLAVSNMVRGLLWPLPGWDLLPAFAFLAGLVVCCVMKVRVGRAIRVVQESAELKAREAAAELRTPRAPDAGPDQCPVCGMDDLAELADDDRFMDRSVRSKLVPYGPRRAHWDCAELVPYVEPNPHFETVEIDGHKLYCACKKCESAAYHPGAYYRCKFCGFFRRALSVDAAREKLIAHAKECPKRPRPTAATGKLRASVSVDWVKLGEEFNRG